jgi:hypothetical protein
MRPMWRRAASVAASSLVLYGCAAARIAVAPAARPGYIATRPGRPGFVVAAPHATSDPNTGEIAQDIARRTGFGLAVATGFSIEPDLGDGKARRYQVNRPLEGTPGRPAAEEAATEAARQVYEAWERRVMETAQGPLVVYVEIHGNNRAETAARIEVATVGVDEREATKLRTLLELTRDAHVAGHPGAPRLEVLVEPADRLVYNASGAKRVGIFRLPERGLHIELPRVARRQWRAVYTDILADFLAQVAALGER